MQNAPGWILPPAVSQYPKVFAAGRPWSREGMGAVKVPVALGLLLLPAKGLWEGAMGARVVQDSACKAGGAVCSGRSVHAWGCQASLRHLSTPQVSQQHPRPGDLFARRCSGVTSHRQAGHPWAPMFWGWLSPCPAGHPGMSPLSQAAATAAGGEP